MGGTVQIDTAGVTDAGDRLRGLAADVVSDGRCRSVAIVGDEGALARAIAELATAESQVSAAIAAELRRVARTLDELHDDTVAADR